MARKLNSFPRVMDTEPSPLTDDFLLTLVHDLRAYVRKSLSGVQLIERSFTDGLELPVQQRFDLVISANKDLEKFLSRLSDYAGAASLRKGRPLPLGAAIQSAALQFAVPSIDVSQIENNETSITVPQETVRLFTELIDNALKFSKGGTVEIELSDQDPQSAQVMIRDSGIGIRPGEEEHVFELLVRLNSNDDYPGFGLGLPICRKIADAIGAEVDLSANPSGGTVATVKIRTEN